jgi:predicted metal-dependent peptidase
MCTNGLCVYYNPDFVLSQNPHIEGSLLHEFWHIILRHPGRIGTRDPKDANIAADAVINPMVTRRGWTLPDGCVDIPEVVLKRMSFEKAYEWIRNQRDQEKANSSQPNLDQDQDQDENEDSEGSSGGEGNAENNAKPESDDTGNPENQDNDAKQGSGSSGSGNGNNKPESSKVPQPGSAPMMAPPSAEEVEEFSKKIQRAVNSAMEKAEARGDAPADVKRALVEVEAPPPRDWRSLLEEMAVNNRDEASRTWSRPNRRWLANNEWRPGYDRTKINRIAVCMDVSGSMNNEAISEGKRVVAELMENHIISHATLIATDTGITAMGDVSDPQEILDFNLGRTGGGTNFIAAMKKVAELSDCVGCVFLTDMQTDYFGEDPGIPTLWVDWTTWNHGYKPKFGTVTKFKTQGAN